MVDERKINGTLLDNNDDEDVITRPGASDEKNVVMIRPEMAVSNNAPPINKEEYAILQRRYLNLIAVGRHFVPVRFGACMPPYCLIMSESDRWSVQQCLH
jgi:hypothetical protein